MIQHLKNLHSLDISCIDLQADAMNDIEHNCKHLQNEYRISCTKKNRLISVNDIEQTANT